MRLILALTTLLAAFGCTTAETPRYGSAFAYQSREQLVDEDAAAILSGMQRARADQAHAGL